MSNKKNASKKTTVEGGVGKRHGSNKHSTGNISRVTDPALKRLCRRAGIKRATNDLYEETRGVLTTFLNKVVADAVVYTQSSGRKTVTMGDVVHALGRSNMTFYG